MKKHVTYLTCLALVGVLLGCSPEATAPLASEQSTSPLNVAGSKFLLSTQPDAVDDVISVRETARDGDDVVITGRIGGSANPWIEGRAAFSIVDHSLTACSDVPGDNCPQPWDYCCETAKLPSSTALVKVVDERGDLVAVDARQLLGVTELSSVIVQGRAQRDDAGNLTIVASGVYRKEE